MMDLFRQLTYNKLLTSNELNPNPPTSLMRASAQHPSTKKEQIAATIDRLEKERQIETDPLKKSRLAREKKKYQPILDYYDRQASQLFNLPENRLENTSISGPIERPKIRHAAGIPRCLTFSEHHTKTEEKNCSIPDATPYTPLFDKFEILSSEEQHAVDELDQVDLFPSANRVCSICIYASKATR